MSVYFEAKRLFYNQTGLGNYCRWLLRGLKQHDPAETWHLLTPDNGPSPYLKEFTDASYRIHQYANPLGLARTFMLGRNLGRGDILHGLSAELPFHSIRPNYRQIVTVHDVIFMSRKHDYAMADRMIYTAKLRHAVHTADRIVCVSQYTADDLKKYLRVDEQKIRVIYQNCDPVFYQAQVHCTDETLPLSLPKSYWLCVSSFGPRKNLNSVVEAYRTMSREDRQPVVMVGSGRLMQPFIEAVRRHELDPWFIFLHNLDTPTLAWLYRHSLGLIYPSLMEGFGIPAVEAMASDVPVIAHRGSVLQEIAGAAGIYANCLQPEELAGAIVNIQNNPQWRSGFQIQAKEELKKFDNSTLIHEYHQLYHDTK
ncbi:MAG: glycosyltransferase family 4 protein [Saprospiraceae bacterium]|nr:glycosyltransferase family 4 protein [Saprospiraceae bacterium]HMW38297.1 glycosyltransferase family 1 protein [Saprospiraceae bacterium]HMX89552.1 glycosyltransferase family 1 protein [Saprospiraceae bacterium]HNA64439.1 glycosyltransferase family 1 protein [Saprospiraceae bacterium]HNB31308.1 glycosyltransferase family 1 protein [Saprospiraceae bacterium]